MVARTYAAPANPPGSVTLRLNDRHLTHAAAPALIQRRGPSDPDASPAAHRPQSAARSGIRTPAARIDRYTDNRELERMFSFSSTVTKPGSIVDDAVTCSSFCPASG